MQLSTQQQRVLHALRQAKGPLGAYALLDRLRCEGLKSPVQVYRILAKLTNQGLVHRLETLNAYVTRSDRASDAFRLFSICDRCGHVDELVDADLGEKLGRCTKSQAFRLSSKAVEVRGLCAARAGRAIPVDECVGTRL